MTSLRAVVMAIVVVGTVARAWAVDEYSPETLAEWQENRYGTGFRAYEGTGEVDFWRLEATLNDLGTSFVFVDNH